LVGSGLNVVQESKSRKAEIAPTILNSFEDMYVLSEGLQWNFVFSVIFIQFSVLDKLAWILIRIQFIWIIERKKNRF
jgi:hypothetical protein